MLAFTRSPMSLALRSRAAIASSTRIAPRARGEEAGPLDLPGDSKPATLSRVAQTGLGTCTPASRRVRFISTMENPEVGADGVAPSVGSSTSVADEPKATAGKIPAAAQFYCPPPIPSTLDKAFVTAKVGMPPHHAVAANLLATSCGSWELARELYPERMPGGKLDDKLPDLDDAKKAALAAFAKEVTIMAPLWTIAERDQLLHHVSAVASGFAAGGYSGKIVTVVAGARGSGKSHTLRSIMDGIHMTWSPPQGESNDVPQRLYTGVLRNPVFLLPDPSCADGDMFSKPPTLVSDWEAGALPMPPVLVAVELLRMQGVEVPGGYDKLPGDVAERYKWLTWSEYAFKGDAYRVLRDWLKKEGKRLIFVLDEWQNNFIEQIDHKYRLGVIQQLTAHSYIDESIDATAMHVIVAGSSMSVVPTLRRSGPVKATHSESDELTLRIPAKRMPIHPHRLDVIYIHPVQTTCQGVLLLRDLARELVYSEGFADHATLQESQKALTAFFAALDAEKKPEKRAEYLEYEPIGLRAGSRTVDGLLEHTSGLPRLIELVLRGVRVESDGSLQSLSLSSRGEIASVLWAMAMALRGPTPQADSASLSALLDPSLPVMAPAFLGRGEVRRKLTIIREQLAARGLHDEMGQCLNPAKLDGESGSELVRDWATAGWLLVDDTRTPSRIAFPSQAHFRAAIRIAAEHEMQVHPDYVAAMLTPAGNLARVPGEFLLQAAMAGVQPSGRTALCELVSKHAAVSSHIDDGVIAALVAEDHVYGSEADRRYGQSLARAMGKLGKLGAPGLRGATAMELSDLAAGERAALKQAGLDEKTLSGVGELRGRQFLLRTVVALAVDELRTFSTHPPGHRVLSDPPSPLLWKPEDGAPPARGQLFQRSGGDFGLDFGGGAWLTASVFLAAEGQKKLRAEKSSNATLTRGFVSAIAAKLHYEATSRGVVKAMSGGDGALIVPLLCAVTNLPLGKDAATELQGMDSDERQSPANAFRRGQALDWTTPVEELVTSDRDKGGEKVAQSSFVEKVSKLATRKDKRGKWKLPIEGGWEYKRGKAIDLSLIPKGGLALLTTKETMKAAWPAEVLALAQEFNLTCFGAGETAEEKRAVREGLRARLPASVWGSTWTLKTKAEWEADEKREREEQQRKEEQQKKEEEEMLVTALYKVGITRDRLEKANLPITYALLISPVDVWTPWFSAAEAEVKAMGPGGPALLQLAREWEIKRVKARD